MIEATRGRVRIETAEARVRTYFQGRMVADSARPVLVWEKPSADSRQPRLLFETGLTTRYYLPLTDVRMDLMRPSSSASDCPYKGVASYGSLETRDTEKPDIAWICRTPLPESQKIAGLVSFNSERADMFVDGVLQDRPRSGIG